MESIRVRRAMALDDFESACGRIGTIFEEQIEKAEHLHNINRFMVDGCIDEICEKHSVERASIEQEAKDMLVDKLHGTLLPSKGEHIRPLFEDGKFVGCEVKFYWRKWLA